MLDIYISTNSSQSLCNNQTRQKHSHYGQFIVQNRSCRVNTTKIPYKTHSSPIPALQFLLSCTQAYYYNNHTNTATNLRK